MHTSIQPRILELYKFMGVLPDIQKKGGPVFPFIHFLPNGETKTLHMVSKGELAPDKPYVCGFPSHRTLTDTR